MTAPRMLPRACLSVRLPMSPPPRWPTLSRMAAATRIDAAVLPPRELPDTRTPSPASAHPAGDISGNQPAGGQRDVAARTGVQASRRERHELGVPISHRRSRLQASAAQRLPEPASCRASTEPRARTVPPRTGPDRDADARQDRRHVPGPARHPARDDREASLAAQQGDRTIRPAPDQ